MGILKNGTFCPLIKKDCVGITCAWYTRVQGVDTNTGNQVDNYECAISWLDRFLATVPLTLKSPGLLGS
jgi:hypothetical protein